MILGSEPFLSHEITGLVQGRKRTDDATTTTRINRLLVHHTFDGSVWGVLQNKHRTANLKDKTRWKRVMNRHILVSKHTVGRLSRHDVHQTASRVCGTTRLTQQSETARSNHVAFPLDSSQLRNVHHVLSRRNSSFQRVAHRTFATITGTHDLEYPEAPEMSTAELQQLAMKYARQNNPVQAQAVVEKLVSGKTSDKVECTSEELSIVLASVIDCWLNYQTKQMEKLRGAVAQDESINLQHALLEEILYAAESASELVENMSTTSPHHVLASLKAWANVCVGARVAGCTKLNWIRGIPQRAQHMFATHEDNQSLEGVNQVLKAWAYSGEHLRGTMAEQFFNEQLLSSGTGPLAMSPSGDSYRFIMRAWCWSNERRCAFTATGHFMRMMRLLEFGRDDMEPTIEDYHILFNSWTKAEYVLFSFLRDKEVPSTHIFTLKRDKTAPSKAYTVLEIAESVYRKGLTEIRPDLTCYQDALFTMAQRVNVPEVGELVDKTLLEMKKERMMIPDTKCYRASILAWKNVATAREYGDREGAIQRAFELLQEMIKAFHRTTVVTVKPATQDFNIVLEALSGSKLARATKQASALLDVMESSENEEGMTDALPDADTFRHLLSVWRASKKIERVDQASVVLDRFKGRMDQIRNISTDQAVVQAFSAFISVCASAAGRNETVNSELFAKAMKTIDDLRSYGLEPDTTTYTALLEASGKLLTSEGRDRHRALENIFVRACQNGYVDQAVLEQFKVSASTFLYAKLVVSQSQEVDGQKVIPESWTRNVTGYLVNSRGGRKVLPLTIDGQFTTPRAATEYKMRKLRRQSNKKMLQGGRM